MRTSCTLYNVLKYIQAQGKHRSAGAAANRLQYVGMDPAGSSFIASFSKEA
jgi:hypothetical protein